MSLLPIVKTPNPVLRQTAKPVFKIDKRIARLIVDMADTLTAQKNPEGVGLAAPQVGQSLRIFLTKPNKKSEIKIFINPEIVSPKEFSPKDNDKGKKSKLLEGCLSIPGIYSDIKRVPKLRLKYDTLNIKDIRDSSTKQYPILTQTINETFSGFLAQVVQHELDHLNGQLFVDLAIKQKQKILKLINDQWEEITLGTS